MLTLLALCFSAVPLSAQTIWDGTADVSWYDASETSFDISTPEQLAGVAQLVNNGTTSFNGKTLNLTADLWLNSTGDSTNNWVPIGGGSPTSESPSTGSAFKGNFNGHGYAIYNLYCDKGSTFHAGLFCALENPCTIDSLVLYNPVLKSRGMMGCITGYPRGSSSIYIRHCLVVNARIVGENSNGSNNIGGICGATYPNSGSTYIQNCGVTGSITGYYPAGIAGNAERSYITNAYFCRHTLLLRHELRRHDRAWRQPHELLLLHRNSEFHHAILRIFPRHASLAGGQNVFSKTDVLNDCMPYILPL